MPHHPRRTRPYSCKAVPGTAKLPLSKTRPAPRPRAFLQLTCGNGPTASRTASVSRHVNRTVARKHLDESDAATHAEKCVIVAAPQERGGYEGGR